MDWKATRPAIEIVTESIAAACLGAAAGFLVLRLVPTAGWLVAVGAGLATTVSAWLVLARVDRDRDTSAAWFEVGDFVAADEPDVLLLDDPLEVDDELLLDDPLPPIDANSRVVRLFAAAPVSGEPATAALPGPGDMVARIEDFLGLARGGAAADPAPHANRASPDASAALHAALADIRRSLRQG